MHYVLESPSSENGTFSLTATGRPDPGIVRDYLTIPRGFCKHDEYKQLLEFPYSVPIFGSLYPNETARGHRWKNPLNPRTIPCRASQKPLRACPLNDRQRVIASFPSMVLFPIPGLAVAINQQNHGIATRDIPVRPYLSRQ
jgi:hypothetical protein